MFSISRASRTCLSQRQCISKFHASSAKKGKSKSVTTAKKEKSIASPKVGQSTSIVIISHMIQEAGSNIEVEESQKEYKSRIEFFLENLDASGRSPDLEDLKVLKPSQPSGPGSLTYAQEYNDATKRVMRAFTISQMSQLLNQLNYGDKLPGNQRALVRILLERSWGWIPPELVTKKKVQQHDMESKRERYLERMTPY
jgi:hypothetical protein